MSTKNSIFCKYCIIQFPKSKDLVYYLCSDMDLKEGDQVVTPAIGRNHREIVTVSAVIECKKSETPIPIDQMFCLETTNGADRELIVKSRYQVFPEDYGYAVREHNRLLETLLILDESIERYLNRPRESLLYYAHKQATLALEILKGDLQYFKKRDRYYTRSMIIERTKLVDEEYAAFLQNKYLH